MVTHDRASISPTVGEAALELRCSAPTIRRRIASGELPAVKLGSAPNAGIRIPRAAMERWLADAAHGASEVEGETPDNDRTPAVAGASPKADDGTRTHDLLHGTQTL
jgi:excisionase family DNA binding protein